VVDRSYPVNAAHRGLRNPRRIFMKTDTATATVTHPAGMRRFAYAALLAGTVALGVTALGHSGVASAEWDIEAYDKCMGRPHVEEPHHPYHADCCVASGGVVDGEGGCRAPVDLTVSGTPLGPKLNVGQPGRQPVPPTNALGTQVN
jgi:hypothetical protein